MCETGCPCFIVRIEGVSPNEAMRKQIDAVLYRWGPQGSFYNASDPLLVHVRCNKQTEQQTLHVTSDTSPSPIEMTEACITRDFGDSSICIVYATKPNEETLQDALLDKGLPRNMLSET